MSSSPLLRPLLRPSLRARARTLGLASVLAWSALAAAPAFAQGMRPEVGKPLQAAGGCGRVTFRPALLDARLQPVAQRVLRAGWLGRQQAGAHHQEAEQGEQGRRGGLGHGVSGRRRGRGRG